VIFQEILQQVLQRIPDYEIEESSIAPYPDRGFAQGWVSLPARFTPSKMVSIET
jgi:hypothetical protein